jgi:hypothetical protein
LNKLIPLSLLYIFPIFNGANAQSSPIGANVKASETILYINNPQNKTVIELNLPAPLDRLSTKKKTLLIFFALPNGNSIGWTKGKQMQPGDDWHYDIQHIAAQTRWLRQVMDDQNVIVAYMANELKSWPAWKKQQPNGPLEIKRIVDSIAGIFAALKPSIMLNSHSGGGSFIFGYLDAVENIPEQVSRIAFIDSDYGYEDSMHTAKIVRWLRNSDKHYLDVLAYNDSVVIYNGKPLVSPTGGTWYRTKLMQQKLSNYFSFNYDADTSFIHFNSLSNRVDIYLKMNPEGKIYHTEQVARNGFIHTVISGTKYQEKAPYQYWGDRVYTGCIY